MAPDGVILDECEHGRTEDIQNKIFPMFFERNRVCVFMGTENASEQNRWLREFAKYIGSDGRLSYFVNKTIICEECKKKGGIMLLTCTHGKSVGRKRTKNMNTLFSYMMDHAPNTILSELVGYSPGNVNMAFPKEAIEKLFQPKNMNNSKRFRSTEFDYLIVSVDPPAGGTNEGAIVIGGFNKIKRMIEIFYFG